MQMNFNPTKSQEFIKKKKDQSRLFKKNVGYKILFLGKEGPQECTIPVQLSGCWNHTM